MRIRFCGALVLTCLIAMLGACSTTPPAPVAGPIPTIVVPTIQPTAVRPTYRVQRGEVADMLEVDGRIVPKVEQDVFFVRNGYIATLAVQVGDMVKEGQQLAELDLGELPAELTRAQNDSDNLKRGIAEGQQRRRLSIQSAQVAQAAAQDRLTRAQQPASAADLREAEAGVGKAQLNLEGTRATQSAAKTHAKAAIDLAANALRDSQSAYSKIAWQNGQKPLDQLKPDARAAQEQAQRAVDNAQTALDQAKVAYDLTVQSEINAIALAEQDIQSAKTRLEVLQAGPDPLVVAEARHDLRSAQIALTSAQTAANDAGVANQITDINHTIEDIQKQIKESRAYAPMSGMVAVVGVKPGDKLEAYAPIVTVVDPQQLELAISEIPADKLAQLDVGQEASIRFTATAGKVISGTVTHLPSDQTTGASGVRADARLRIGFDPANLTLAVGDAASITIALKRAADALWLPPVAIHAFDQRRFVTILDGAQERQVDITVGIVTPDRIQILDGVREGQVIVGSIPAP